MTDPSTPPPKSALLMMDKDILRLSRHNLLQPLMFGVSPHHGRRTHSGQSPIKKVIFNMLNNILGAGIIALPYVFGTCGLMGGLLLMFIFSFISAYSLRLLMISATFCKQRNYEDLCEYLFGTKGYTFVSAVLFIFDFGASLSYLIILGDASSQIIAIWGYDTLFHRQMLILVLSIFLIFPTLLPRDISKIEKISAVSVFSVVLIMIMVVYQWIATKIVTSHHHNTPLDIKWGFDPNGLPIAIGIIAFSFLCHDCSFLLYNTLKNPTIRRWTMLAYSGSFVAMAICACFAIPGYLTFGSRVQDNILNNYDTHNKMVIGARGLYCVTMALTYPGSFFVVRHVCYVIFHRGPQYESITTAPLSTHLLFTIPLFAVNVVMAIYIRNLGIVMSISGSLSAVILAFCLPPVCYLKICKYKIRFWKEADLKTKWLAFKTTFPPLILCVFGALIAVFSTSFTILQHYGLRFI